MAPETETAPETVPSVRLVAPFDLIEDIGDPLNVWQICFLCDDELKDLDKKYLAYIRVFYNENGDAFPGLPRIAEDLGVSTKTIGPMRKRIKARGYLDIVPGRRGRYYPTRCWPRLPDFTDPSVIVSHRKQMRKPTFVSYKGPIEKLLFVSKRGSIVSEMPPNVSPSGNMNREQITKSARRRAGARNGAALNAQTEAK